MPVPDYQSVMLPLLSFANDGNQHTTREAVEYIAGQFDLTQEERSALLPSGQQTVLANRVGWAKSYMKKAGLIEDVTRGVFRITGAGTEVIRENPPRIDVTFLMRFPPFVEFREAARRERNGHDTITAPPPGIDTETPEEALERAFVGIRDSLAQELLARVASATPEFFERLVVELLVKMGYGGSRADAGERVGQTGDGGIDGIIKEDRLGLDVIYLQAKRWERAVGSPEVMNFIGALDVRRAKKGVFLTTSRFTADAKEMAAQAQSKIVLIDGPTLSRLMIDFDLAVSTVATYPIKRLDSDYFEEE